MTPADLRRYLAIHADGELPADARDAVERVLAGDPACRAEVARWQTLRRCAHRGLASEPVPAHLRERVMARLAAARRPPRGRAWPVLGVLTAAAAMIVLSVASWWRTGREEGADQPLAAPAVPVLTAESLADIFQRCALHGCRNSLALVDGTVTEAREVITRTAAIRFAARLPDLTEQGYRLAGLCCCSPREGLRTVHAYYERLGRVAAQPPQPGDRLSFFCLECCIELERCQSACGQTPGARHPQRRYALTTTADNVTVVKWDEQSLSYALCGVLPETDLVRLVDAVDLAWRPAAGAPLASRRP